MKRFSAYLLLLCMLLGCTACGAAAPLQDDGKIKVVTTIFPPYDFVRQIAGDRVSLTMLIKPGTETHTYEPSPQDIIAVENCDIFIYAGGESDTWADGILADLLPKGTKVIAMLDCVDALEEEHPAGAQSPHGHIHDHDHHDHDHANNDEDDGEDTEHKIEYDEHVWTSPINCMEICHVIAHTLSETDPENAAFYEANLEVYEEKLITLDQAFREVTHDSAGKKLVFGDRFPLLYFIRAYGLTCDAAFPGCAESTEPNAATLAHLIETVRSENIPLVFCNELSSGRVAAAIAEETGARAAVFYSCHTISKNDFDNGETYISIMQRNIPVLKEALAYGTD